MKKICTIAFCFASICSFSQGKTLSNVSLVKPKIGQTAAFEAAWKAHVAKFHGKDQSRSTYEILTGNNTGAYLLVEAPISFDDMDKTRPDEAAHDRDYEMNISPKLEMEGGDFIYGYRDSLSIHPEIVSEKALVTITHVKNGRMQDYLAEVRRGTNVTRSMNLPYGVTGYVLLFAGSDPTYVSIRSLKDGYKEMEDGYFKLAPNAFRDSYVKMFSQDQWDKRLLLLTDAIVSRDQYFMKVRKDLSTK